MRFKQKKPKENALLANKKISESAVRHSEIGIWHPKRSTRHSKIRNQQSAPANPQYATRHSVPGLSKNPAPRGNQAKQGMLFDILFQEHKRLEFKQRPVLKIFAGPAGIIRSDFEEEGVLAGNTFSDAG